MIAFKTHAQATNATTATTAQATTLAIPVNASANDLASWY